ncbi:hypothetical protein M569_15891 [Genlisea aurea]|uniref:Protein kinase domain-containing protein n=1 Tax=Genlisea aurea TaxID=192259 RepID=S8C3I5_9LAMI|nr:hypothetical protein M569_15891 [Genlisea aurea]
MGCATSKPDVSVTPMTLDCSGGGSRGDLVAALEVNLSKVNSNGGSAGEFVSFRLANLHRYVEGELVAAGWPAWLTAVAGEAIHGWVPLKADSFEKLEKIGQGTYSTVFRARELESGRIVALKKVRFDSLEPESVRFMAREILILRRLNHPNIIELQGLIASPSSCSIYLVFEYMDHDISGLLSSPDITFTQPQVKCYAKQLLSGLEHCHSRGVMHRDIKGANLLVDNAGVLKIADFGLANFSSLSHNRHLTSRVVTLWYRPPELLLGSTDYGVGVDLWSAGCLLAELLTGRPILQGRTEVEQLHKIFKLCGSPPEDYWNKSKLPHATLFRPKHPYESTLLETFKDQPEEAVDLIQTLLAVDPHKRGTAASALSSQYFKRKPFACDPSSLPQYPPSKEIDIKHHEDAARRKQPGARSRKPTQNGTTTTTTSHPEQGENNGGCSVEMKEEQGSQMKKENPPCPVQVSASTGFAWARKAPPDTSSRTIRPSSRSLNTTGSSTIAVHLKNKLDREGGEMGMCQSESTNGDESFESIMYSMLGKWKQLEQPDSLDTWDEYHSQELSAASSLYHKMEAAASTRVNVAYNKLDHREKVEFSGPLLSQTTQRINEMLEKHERHIRQAVRRSWFHKVRMRNGK